MALVSYSSDQHGIYDRYTHNHMQVPRPIESDRGASCMANSVKRGAFAHLLFAIP